MNKQQRAIIAAACASLQPFADSDHCLEHGPAAVLTAVDLAKSVFQDTANDEREKFDNLSEGLQQAENGQNMEAAADALDSAVQELEGIDLKEDVDPSEGWEMEVANSIENAIEHAESF